MNNPSISEAKSLAKKHDKTHLIIIHLDTRSGVFGVVTYGLLGKKGCAEAEKIGQGFYDPLIKIMRELWKSKEG